MEVIDQVPHNAGNDAFVSLGFPLCDCVAVSLRPFHWQVSLLLELVLLIAAPSCMLVGMLFFLLQTLM